MVMGIPTVKRKVKSYLSETLRSLIDKLSPEEKLDCVIIVFVGEVRCPAWDDSLNAEKSTTRPYNVLICFGFCRLILIMLTVWLLTSRKSEYIYSCRNFQVGVSVLHVDATNILFVQVFYRAEFRLTGGDLPTSCLLPRAQRSQGDIWRLQRKSQVRTWLLYVLHLCLLWIVPVNEWTVQCKPSWAFRRK